MVWYGPPLEGWERQPRPNLASSSFRGDQRWLLTAEVCRPQASRFQQTSRAMYMINEKSLLNLKYTNNSIITKLT